LNRHKLNLLPSKPLNIAPKEKVLMNSIGVGKRKEFSLRISVAAIAAVNFPDPENKKTLLALERTATTHIINEKPEVTVKAKPFGGGARLLNPERLSELIGGFNFDSERSLQEKDFRILTNTVSWEKIKEICLKHLKETDSDILDTGAERELEEEFEDSLGLKIQPEDYSLKSNGMVIEDSPANTKNINAPGVPTVRVYYLYEAVIKNPNLFELIINSSRKYSDDDLIEMALQNLKEGGKGRANAFLVVDPDKLRRFYQSVPASRMGDLLSFEEHQLDGNVPVLFEHISNHKYQRIFI
jgi:hypothetical protein